MWDSSKLRGAAAWSLAAVLLISAHSAALGANPPSRPNIVLILADDLGYGDIGSFGSKVNRTPNLDRMAQEGMRLTSHYAAPVCSPSRAALMTGCYPKRALPIPGVLFPAGAVGLHPNERTVAEVLKDADYATGCIGKWHLGDQREFLPTRQGFDYYFGLPYSNDMGTVEDGSKSNPGQPLPNPNPNPKGKAKGKNQQVDEETGLKGFGQPPLPLLENERVIERVRAAEQTTIVKRYTEKAVGFIRQHKDQPFFLYLPHTAVHFPHYPGMEFRGKSQNGLFGDWVEELDWSVGQVLNTIRELGLSEKTLVFFTSDNGGPVNQGATNTPLRGSKASTLEGGIRTCTLAWWPGQVPAGKSTDSITCMMDILPTFARLGGGSVPADRKLDGVDIWPVLAGASGSQPPRDTFHYFRGFDLEAVRQGPWKLNLGRGELYHLGNDIGEASNVASAHPDVVERLRAVAATMQGDLGATGIGPGCRPLGRVENPQPLIGMDGKTRAGFE